MKEFCLAFLFLLLANLPGSAVQKETLIQQLPVLLDHLYVPHDMPYMAVLMAYPVLYAYTVAFLFQLPDTVPQLFPVASYDRCRHHVKAVPHHLFLRAVAQNFECRLIDTDNTMPIPGMAHNPAVHCRKNQLQCAVLPHNLLFVSPFLSHIYGYSHRSHDAAV